MPVINENDTVATAEIRYGDNDRLAARVATMIEADCLVLLSDIDGLYTAPPQLDPTRDSSPDVAEITPEIEAMAGGAGAELSRGGMSTKIEAGKIATGGRHRHGHRHRQASSIRWQRSTRARARPGSRRAAIPCTARKRWIVGPLVPPAPLTVDAGAARALLDGKSLLPAGVTARRGRVRARRRGGHRRSRRARDRPRACWPTTPRRPTRIAGCKQRPTSRRCWAMPARSELVHRDDLVHDGARAGKAEVESDG